MKRPEKIDENAFPEKLVNGEIVTDTDWAIAELTEKHNELVDIINELMDKEGQ